MSLYMHLFVYMCVCVYACARVCAFEEVVSHGIAWNAKTHQDTCHEQENGIQ